MKTIGLIGGMSWESSLEYYYIINKEVKNKLGGLHSAKSLMYSVDFDEILKLQQEGKLGQIRSYTINIAKKLEKSGADIIVICSNTAHKIADEVQKEIKIPLLHIIDATAKQIKKLRVKKVGLLGTKDTMEEDFYKEKLIKKYGLKILIPNEKERQIVHNVIFKELCIGKVKQASKNQFKKIINNLIKNGAEAIVLGCTEITILIKQKDVRVKLFDTARIHAEAAVEYAIK